MPKELSPFLPSTSEHKAPRIFFNNWILYKIDLLKSKFLLLFLFFFLFLCLTNTTLNDHCPFLAGEFWYYVTRSMKALGWIFAPLLGWLCTQGNVVDFSVPQYLLCKEVRILLLP